ncbi:MAG TPA: type II toxin-antitoxin system PemK/MazF family toxin [Anaerolineae bacterium]|nr:type II toxin-antitoxin system PemK/MazF family toxin [Anaerolineae bacterium]
MNERRIFRRGDVVLVSLPQAAEPRPAVVVQNDVGNRFSPNLVVAAISSRIPKREYPIYFVVRQGSTEAQAAGLDRDSVVLASAILTVPKASVVKILGRFPEDAMEAIDDCLRVSLGL